MRSLTEKVTRKIAQTFLVISRNIRERRTLSVQQVPAFHNIDDWFPVKTQLEYFPYHFIEPDQIRQEFVFDQDNIPLRHRTDLRDYRNPAMVAYWGLVHVHDFAQKPSHKSREEALRAAEVICAHARFESGLLFLDYAIDLPRMDVYRPWVSALAQGLAGSLFIRLYMLSDDARYLELARKSIGVLILPVEKGGVLQQTAESLDWMEEYPGDRKTHVLNGFLFALIALIEVGSIQSELYSAKIQGFIRSLATTYSQYRIGHYLRYDRLHADLCNPHYMGLHVMLFYHLYALSGVKQFLSLAQDLEADTDWQLYARSIHYNDHNTLINWIKDQVLPQPRMGSM